MLLGLAFSAPDFKGVCSAPDFKGVCSYPRGSRNPSENLLPTEETLI